MCARTIQSALPALLMLGACSRPQAAIAPYAERREVETQLDRFRQAWLEPAHVAPPTIAFEARSQAVGPLSFTITPVRAEDASWNTWPDGGLRLFNNRSAYLFHVRVTGPGALRWLPDETRLELNVAGPGVTASASPEDHLLPLFQAAAAQERWGIDGDMVQRTRGAGAFRAAYLPSAQQDGSLEGLIAFPAESPDLHVVVLRVRVGVTDTRDHHVAVWTFD